MSDDDYTIDPAVAVDVPAVEPEVESEPEPEPEALKRIHPSAVLGYVPTRVEIGDDEFFIGYWGKQRLYGCPYCPYSTTDGNGFVDVHVLSKADAGEARHVVHLSVD